MNTVCFSILRKIKQGLTISLQTSGQKLDLSCNHLQNYTVIIKMENEVEVLNTTIHTTYMPIRTTEALLLSQLLLVTRT